MPSPNDPQSLNRFSYTRNNPLKYIDPSGHMECYGYASSNKNDMGSGVGADSCIGGEWDLVADEEVLGNLEDQVRKICSDGSCGPTSFGGRLVRSLTFAVGIAAAFVNPVAVIAGGATGVGGYTVGTGVGNLASGNTNNLLEGFNGDDAMMALVGGGLTFGQNGLVTAGVSGAQYIGGQLMNDKQPDLGGLIGTVGLSSISTKIQGAIGDILPAGLPGAIRGVSQNAVIPYAVDSALSVASTEVSRIASQAGSAMQNMIRDLTKAFQGPYGFVASNSP